jgi:xylose isomerase
MRVDELRFASRLNSMKDRRDLCTDAAHSNDVLGWVARQGGVRGLTHVDFNYPQHLEAAGVSVEAARGALAAAGLGVGAICLRYPPKFRLGAMTHPDPALRAEAVALTVAAGRCGGQLGADELVVWSAYCGYDYALQVDYDALWERVVHSFQAVCDALPETKVSLEFKPTDENTRFFAVPSSGAALQLVSDVGRANMGLTLDIGHCLMAGENPAQSVAMVGGRGKLFGVQCNDGYGRLGAEDGLMFGSVNPRMALEFCTWLQKTAYRGHIYFDTFPGVVDPVAECEYNIQRFKALWAQAEQLFPPCAKFIRFTNIGPLRPRSNAHQGRAHTSSYTRLPK